MSEQSPAPPLAEQPAETAAAESEPRYLSIADLDGEHREILGRAITRILSTELAEITYAQIIDGLPIADVAFDRRAHFCAGHPMDNFHEELCPGMLDRVREFRDGFRPEILTFNSLVSRTEYLQFAIDEVADTDV
jgi:hypothetical protein